MDGWTWSDILRSHPEITEDDIRMAMAYTIEAEAPPAETIERQKAGNGWHSHQVPMERAS